MSLSTVMPFGKYKGCTIQYIVDHDSDYAYWLTSICKFLPEVLELIKFRSVCVSARKYSMYRSKEPYDSWNDQNEWDLEFDHEY